MDVTHPVITSALGEWLQSAFPEADVRLETKASSSVAHFTIGWCSVNMAIDHRSGWFNVVDHLRSKVRIRPPETVPGYDTPDCLETLVSRVRKAINEWKSD